MQTDIHYYGTYAMARCAGTDEPCRFESETQAILLVD